jgi:IS5 family transposase
MKTLIDFALKEEYKRLESVGDKLSEIDSLIIGKRFVLFLSLCILTKPFQEGGLKLMSL